MKFYRGRVFDHVHLMVADLDASKRFYRAALESLGLSVVLTEGPGFFLPMSCSLAKWMDLYLVFILRFRPQIRKLFGVSIKQPCRREVATMVNRVNAPTIPATVRLCF